MILPPTPKGLPIANTTSPSRSLELSAKYAGSRFLASIFIIASTADVKEIVSEGVEFDPTVHQAVLMEHDEAKPHGVILEVLQKGYMYKDRVLRPAMVKVNE